jgi:hypothetical protein
MARPSTLSAPLLRTTLERQIIGHRLRIRSNVRAFQ